MAGRALRILVVMRHAGAVRNFESAFRSLALRGHEVQIVFESQKRKHQLDGQYDLIDQICTDHPSIRYVDGPSRDDFGWITVAAGLRLSIDYLRYLEPRYRNADALRERAGLRVPETVRKLLALPLLGSRLGVALLRRSLRFLEAGVPSSPAVEQLLKDAAPDLVVITPLVELGSSQADYVRSCKALGIPSVLSIYSWDNLTNKGLIRDVPDLVTVWNDVQAQEAKELHGVPRQRIAITGAVAYDHWFDWRPSTTREHFCQGVGLQPGRPFVLYVCSSPFIAPHEAAFVEKWLTELRQSAAKDVGVLVRPHPQNAPQWQDVDLSGYGNVAIWPREGVDPTVASAKAVYYDSIYHSSAVIGINTSAQIESAIIGRPVYTILAPEYRSTQEGTLHFHHLLQSGGGLLNVGATFQEHFDQIAAGVAGSEEMALKSRRFVEAFVRPIAGPGSAAGHLVAALEKLNTQPRPRPSRSSLGRAIARLLLSGGAKQAQQREMQRREAARLKKLQEKAAKNGAAAAAAGAAPSERSKTSRFASALLRIPPVRGLARWGVPFAAQGVALVSVEWAKSAAKPREAKAARTALKDVRSALALANLELDRMSGAPNPAAARSPNGSLKGTAAALPAPAPKPVAILRPLHTVLAGVDAEVQRLLNSPSQAIIAGPWIGEVGYELLYWIPFLGGLIDRYPELQSRLVVLSRGGTAHWYRQLTERYVDLFDLMSVEEYFTKREACFAATGGKQKQKTASPIEMEMLQLGANRAGIGTWEVLHPGVMYRAVNFLAKADSIGRFVKMARFRPFTPIASPELDAVLPKKFVTFRFYYNNSFPETEENRTFVGDTLRALSRQTPVVLLNNGMNVDEHHDYVPDDPSQIINLAQYMRPATNLALQSAAISRADAFYGTYGGLSYLPPFLHVPSHCFFSEQNNFMQHHLDLALSVFRGPKWGDFMPLNSSHAQSAEIAAASGPVERVPASVR